MTVTRKEGESENEKDTFTVLVSKRVGEKKKKEKTNVGKREKKWKNEKKNM